MNFLAFITLNIIVLSSFYWSAESFDIERGHGYTNIEADKCFITDKEEYICYSTFKLVKTFDTGIPIIYSVENPLKEVGTVERLKLILKDSYNIE